MALRLDMNLTLTPELRQLALRIGIGFVLLCLAAYVLIGMPLLASRKLDSELTEARGRLERHQKLMPTVTSIIATAHNSTIGSLAVPQREPTPRSQAYLLTEQLAHMATAAGLEPLGVTLNPATMAEDPNTIQAQGEFSGQLEGVRSFLMALGRMPSLARMERVEIRAVEGRLEMMVQMRIAISG